MSEYFEALRAEALAGKTEALRIGDLTIARSDDRLWIYLGSAVIGVQSDTESGRIRLGQSMVRLADDLATVIEELRGM